MDLRVNAKRAAEGHTAVDFGSFTKKLGLHPQGKRVARFSHFFWRELQDLQRCVNSVNIFFDMS